MDFNSLKDQVSNLTLYDLKAGVRKVQNAVMNYTEMEAKVREATNNEPWGASSTIMQEIANGTFNYQTLNEIMPMIYRRFTEKAAEEWRQIYKALQLLEFLIKHGSERVIDDARGHITLLKMLRQFHFIDQNGKDQGINVRNRAKELAELLGDVERIRSERKKARANKAKYTGVEGGTMGGFSGSSGRYGGFGSESSGYGGSSAGYGGFSGGVYGDGGGFGGQSDDWRDSGANRADKFEEYDEFDEGTAPSSSSRAKRPERSERMGVKKTTPTEPPKKKEPEVDLFSFDDPEPAPAATTSAHAHTPSNGSAALASLSTSNTNDDDDFDDFQSATPAPANNIGVPPPMVTSSAQSTAQLAQPKPLSGPQQVNLSGMMSSISPPGSSTTTPAANYSSFSIPAATTGIAAQAPKPATTYQAAQPNYYQSVQVAQPTGSSISAMSSASGVSTPSGLSALNKPAAPAAAKASAGSDPFANLWGQAGSGIKKASTPVAGPKMGQLAKEKTSASLWGAPAAGAPKPANNSQPSGGSSGLDDLLG
ncbi:ENTH-domain-containing protein [Hypoxylon trugodes]|uniref:ENTH-domain-containing protein n=1 Tax=Hypoxylon trugodes TaxID=326681 RepID=UPI00218E93C1|nr:ENTH-domain-containing protein [Hypoxylon trugodes]KAI1384338.1 ENTH-domain-containing protein [Hypoxylon trugodes]